METEAHSRRFSASSLDTGWPLRWKTVWTDQLRVRGTWAVHWYPLCRFSMLLADGHMTVSFLRARLTMNAQPCESHWTVGSQYWLGHFPAGLHIQGHSRLVVPPAAEDGQKTYCVDGDERGKWEWPPQVVKQRWDKDSSLLLLLRVIVPIWSPPALGALVPTLQTTLSPQGFSQSPRGNRGSWPVTMVTKQRGSYRVNQRQTPATLHACH